MITQTKNILSKSLPSELVDKLIDSYVEIKENYYLAKYRPTSFTGGYFSEVGLRIIQQAIDGNYTGLDDRLPSFHDEVVRFGNVGGYHDTLRFHIPRTLEIIHDIRNKRDVGHPKGELDANYSDATLTLNASSWVLVELLRYYYTGDIDEAQRVVNEIIKFQVPLVQDFDGFLKILNPDLALGSKILVWALYRKSEGITSDDIVNWLKGRHTRSYVNRVLRELEHDKAFLHSTESKYFITHTGIIEVSRNVPLVISK